MRFTILGSTGFIGSRVAALATAGGHEVVRPARDESLDGRELGHVIYAIGVTADFRRRPHDTVTAHVTKLQEVLTRASFESLVYLSSTRVYSRCALGSESGDGPPAVSEDTPIPVLSSDFNDLYNLSKLMGESLALTAGPRVRVARLSNVVGADFHSDNFLMSILRDSLLLGRVELKTALESAKDYISVEDVARTVLRLGVEGRQPIYNVAAGFNTTHREIQRQLAECTGAAITVKDGSPVIRFPVIDISRLRSDLGFTPGPLNEILPALVHEFRAHHSQQTSRAAA
jgi:nucleoside-diphosphate-sugar epimerase